MAYTLNTGHALYGNLIELIGVQGGALVSHKTARTFTPESGTTFGSGALGEFFKSKSAGYSVNGAGFTPAVAIDYGTTPNASVFIATSAVGASGFGSFISAYPTDASCLSPGMDGGDHAATFGKYSTVGAASTSTPRGTAIHSMCATRTGETANAFILDGVLQNTGGFLTFDAYDLLFSYIGGYAGQTNVGGEEFVWIAVFDKALSAAEALSLHNSLGASNAFGLVSSGDSTAPTLTSASVTAVAATTATGNITTDEANGTLYSIVSTSATAPSAAQIQAGQNHTGAAAVWSGNQAVSSTGAKTFSITGLTVGNSYYAHFQHKDAANNNSSVVTSAQFTTVAPDTTIPTLTGSVTISAKTTTSYTATWPSGSDNVAVTGYEYRLNSGSWVDVGNVLTTNISGRTPGSTDTFEVRAYDAAGNKSTPALSVSVTLLIGTITIPAVRDWGTGNLKTSETGVQIDIHNISTGALVVRKTGQTTHATTGVCVVQDALLADATTYEVITRFADGSKGMWDYTASLT